MAINLAKGQKINLQTTSPVGLGEILINLNWNSQPVYYNGYGGASGIDLDLGCMYELADGRKGVVQALGNAFGSLTAPPYISLDGDDRTGASMGGENLRINGNMVSQIRRILVYTFIYEGVANWQQANATVTIRYPGAQDIIIRMDTFNSAQKMCGLALLTNVNNDTFSVEKIVQFYLSHQALDQAFGWNMQWVVGTKD